MHDDTLTYTADGLQMHSRLFHTAATASPGVLVFPDAGGLNDHALDRARRLADLGYAALACDLHGQAYVAGGLPEALTLIAPLQADMSRLRARARAALDALTSRPEVDASRTAAMGFCLGGTMSLELARSGAPLAAIVSFHGGLATQAPASPGTIKPRILVCTGADDPMIPPAQRTAFEAEMTASKATWQMHVYGDTVHSFTSVTAAAMNLPDAIRYNKQADEDSWAATVRLLEQAFA